MRRTPSLIPRRKTGDSRNCAVFWAPGDGCLLQNLARTSTKEEELQLPKSSVDLLLWAAKFREDSVD